jgi:hypothetical protein
MRERLVAHAKNPTCASCHRFFDPLGLSLENFDALGRYRETDEGAPLDLAATLDGQRYEGGRELGRLLRADPRSAACMVEQYYRHATGHAPAKSEKPVLDELVAGFAASGHSFRKLIVAIVSSDGFRTLQPPGKR